MSKVKPGYKETEVGKIPEDWEVKKLAEISSLKGRIGWQGLNQSEFTMNDDDPFLITGMNFKEGKIRWNEVYHVSDERYSIAKDIQLEKNDILMTKDGTIGKILFVDYIPYPYKATLNSHLLLFRPKQRSYFEKYLYFQLQTRWFHYYIENYKSGTTFFGISQHSVSKIPIPLPPTLAEQERIATALSDTDSYIEKLEKLIEKKKYIKTGAMQELLTGKKRLPGFGKGKGTKETPVGVIPEDWEVKKLGEVVDFTIKWSLTGGPFGSNLKSSDYCSQGVRIIQLQNIGDGKFLDSYKIYTSELKADELLSCCIYPNEIIISKMGDPVARACLIPSNSSRYLMCSDGIRLVVDKLKFSTKYVLYTINFDIFRNIANLASIGSTRKRIGLKELRFLPLPVPPTLAEQEKIATVLSDMDSEIEKLEVKLEKYKDIKQGMMQKLLTGAVRLV